MKNKLFYFLLAGLSLTGPGQPAHAQTYIKLGTDINSAQDFNYSMCTSNDYYIASGTMMNMNTGNLDISVIYRDGNNLFPPLNFTYDINNGSNDFSGKIRPTRGGVVVVGTTGGLFGHPKDMFAMCLDMSGNVIYQAIYTLHDPHINLYGFDVVYEPSDNTYIMVGMGDYTVSNTSAENRFGVVMKVSADLQTILWSNKYVTSPSIYGPYYDGITDIERISNGSGIFYYLTGSITDQAFAGLQQGVFNMLIDNTGTLIWDNPFDASNSSDIGCNAVYDDANNVLYVLHENSASHSPNIATVDFTTGAVTANYSVLPLQMTDNMGYAIEWSDNTHTHIVLHGIVNHPGSCSYPAINYLIELDPANPTFPIWQKSYPPVFSGADLTAVSYDWVVKPSYSQLTPPFFVPHTFVPNYTVNMVNPFYTVIGTSQSNCGSGIMQNLMFQTNNFGNLQSDQCYNNEGAYSYTNPYVFTVTPGAYNPLPLFVLQPNVIPDAPPRNDVSACPYMPKHSNTNAVAQVENKTFNLYPNPATDMINVAVPAGTVVKSVYIVDALGHKTDYPNTVYGNNIELNIANLAAGIYYMQLTTGDEIKHFKFVKE